MSHYIERWCPHHGEWLQDSDSQYEVCDECPKPELRIIFDGPPGPEAGRFVEAEDSLGRSINCGEWRERNGFWELTITELPKAFRKEEYYAEWNRMYPKERKEMKQ